MVVMNLVGKGCFSDDGPVERAAYFYPVISTSVARRYEMRANSVTRMNGIQVQERMTTTLLFLNSIVPGARCRKEGAKQLMQQTDDHHHAVGVIVAGFAGFND